MKRQYKECGMPDATVASTIGDLAAMRLEKAQHTSKEAGHPFTVNQHLIFTFLWKRLN